MQWALYGLWGRGKGIYATHYALALTEMCAREGCSHRRTFHSKVRQCIAMDLDGNLCKCNEFVQNEIFSNWGIYLDSSVNHDFGDVKSFFPHCHPLRLDEFLGFENPEELGLKYARKVFIDEPYAWGLDARRSSSYFGIQATSQGFQHRKTVGDIFITTQLPSRLDRSMRFASDDFMIAVKPTNWGYHYVWFGNSNFPMHLERQYVQDVVWPHYNHKEKIVPHFMDEFDQEELVQGWQEDKAIADHAMLTARKHIVFDNDGPRAQEEFDDDEEYSKRESPQRINSRVHR